MVGFIWIFDDLIGILVGWICLLYGEEFLLYVNLFYIFIGIVGFWCGVFFGVVVIIGFIFMMVWNFDLYGFVVYCFFEV